MNFSKAKKYIILLILITPVLSGCREKKPPEFTEQQQKEMSDKLLRANKALVKKDQLRIQGYVNRNQPDMKKTGTGLWYLIENKGEGKKVEKGDMVNLKYTVSLLENNKVCYSSDKDGIKSFVVGQGGVESGLEDGILLMHEGDKAKLILPPHLAHGLTGDGDKIPARAIIIYDLELISIQ